MFGKKKAKSIEINKLSSLIADNVEIVGDVIFSGGLRVDGRIEGNVINKGDELGLLVLSERGCIEGSVRTHDAVINGTIVGDLSVTHFLELQPKARVTGNISYSQLQMDCGASVEGKLEKLEDTADSGTKVLKFGNTPAPAAASASGKD
ncbi:bactofilin family protein [Denitromonas iodatirespirans]|uniref:Polymer-forming cytoskeletal protein n=1 Tax=Denitromonas iodatirespirans TaxID=2795389 RepID=A0A944HAE9_DENI1|nr:polymer-forming cytoskeletal protein [Denitromonas iodatirespirans]MBT0963400.1 polymer-forming cytoskeletal protein [Denitromonas iodatirespirans]